MSFRELRNLTEMMRILGYPGLISMESFNNPNFVLVADMLYWMVQRYDPSADLDDSISTEGERIQFLKSVAQKMFYNARIKLNLKRLYGADRHAVAELLKIASLLNKALQMAQEDSSKKVDQFETSSGNLMDKIRSIRTLASELTDMGAELYDSLNDELELRKDRTAILDQPAHSSSDLKHILEERVAETQDVIANIIEQAENLETDQENLMVKKKRKLADFERFKKSLARLQTFKPSFMEDYEKKELELHHVYSEYVSRWRNLEYLEHVMDAYRRKEEMEIEEKNRKLTNMRKKLKDEELMILRGEGMLDAGLEDDELDAAYLSKQRSARNLRRPRAASRRRPAVASQPRVPIHEALYDDDIDDDDDDDNDDDDEDDDDNEDYDSDDPYGDNDGDDDDSDEDYDDDDDEDEDQLF